MNAYLVHDFNSKTNTAQMAQLFGFGFAVTVSLYLVALSAGIILRMFR